MQLGVADETSSVHHGILDLRMDKSHVHVATSLIELVTQLSTCRTQKLLSLNFVFRLDDQREDCQTKFGCRIQFMDFAMMKDSDRKVLGDLSQKILDNCISEDDMEYFRLQDDTSLMQKTFFDL